jgi:hypothetical protein
MADKKPREQPKQKPSRPKYIPLSEPSRRSNPRPSHKGGGTGVRPKKDDN